jgi:hypothetical protein
MNGIGVGDLPCQVERFVAGGGSGSKMRCARFEGRFSRAQLQYMRARCNLLVLIMCL